MIKITLPDNSVKTFSESISLIDIAKSLSLSKKVIACKVNDKILDLNTMIFNNAKIEFILIDSLEGLNIIRHDAAHMLAQAVQELFGKNIQITIGPATKDGFYYDFDKIDSFSLNDLTDIEKKMQEISRKKYAFKKISMSRNEAIDFFAKKNQTYKVEIIKSIPSNENITLYQQGDFIDLCRGPHAPHTGFIKYFKLLRITGAYWRGDSKNKMLQRIYGTAFATQKDLNNYLLMLEESKKRDHRKIGAQCDLFHFQKEAMGSVFWHEKGWTIYLILERYIRTILKKNNYIEVKTPVLLNSDLWKKSGHWDKFRKNMFVLKSEDNEMLGIKPMNCPCHIQIFNINTKSYKELPIRMSEFGSCHRYEPSGALHGLMRVRQFTQDDAHIFCRESHITDETVAFCNLLQEVYNKCGFTNIKIKFATRPEIRAGSDDVWNKAEKALETAIKHTKLQYETNIGEGAFYGPKLEFVLTDSLQREWQCGTIQVDFVLPQRLNANFINEKGEKETVIMLHRAILGSFERFIGILIEHYAGRLPLWLTPVQIVFLPLSEKYHEYIEKNILPSFKEYRIEFDKTSGTLSSKIREYILKKYIIICIIGENEISSGNIQVTHFISGKKTQSNMNISELQLFLKQNS